MNERIREIEIETDAWCDANFPTNWTDRVDEFLPLWNKKFAELIVRECISRIDGCAVETSPDDFVKGYNKGVSKVSSQVKQHFGIDQ